MKQNKNLESGQDPDEKQQLLTQGTVSTAAQQLTQSENEPVNLRKTWVRWLMLIMTCCFLLGSYFCYDNPGPLQTQLQQQFHIDSTKFSLLYTVYSLPNMVLPVFGGILLDRIGVRPGLIIFTMILTIGQFVFMMGGFQNDFNMLLAGRIIFGMGGECMNVAQSSIISKWFRGKELSFALGLNMSVSKLGSVINAAVVPAVYQSSGLGYALGVGFLICVFSLANAFGLVCLDKKAETKEDIEEAKKIEKKGGFKLSGISQFGASYWLLTASCVITYMTVFPYIMIASDTLQTKYKFDKIKAGYFFGIPYIISAVSSPFLGLLIDKIGKRGFMICLSSVILVFAFFMSMMAPECHQCNNEIYPLVMTGIGYSIYAAAIWGSIPYVVPESAVGSAFGLTTAIQNIGLCVAPTLVGFIKDKTIEVDHGFFWVHAFFLIVNVLGFILNAMLYYIDLYYNDRVLDTVKNSDQKANQKKGYDPLFTEESEPLTRADRLANPNSSLDLQD